MTTRAILYLRLSKGDEELEAGAGRQLELLKRMAATLGYTVVAILGLEDRSASRYAVRQRKQYRAAMRMIDDGAADAILFYDLDRLLRIPRELEDLIDRVVAGQRRGGRRLEVRSANGEIDLTTADGQFVARILVAMAAKEADNTSRRVKSHRAELTAKGLPPLGAAYGWIDAVTPHDAEAAVVRSMVARTLAGESLSSIARRLNDAGVAKKRDTTKGRWAAGDVASILRTPRNYGLVRRPDTTTTAGAFAGIVPAEYFGQVVGVLAERAKPSRRPRRASMLAGLLFCERCGNPLQANTTGALRPVFTCRRQVSTDRCGGGSIDRELVEGQITRIVQRYVDTLDLAALADPAAAPDTTAIRERLAAIPADIEEATTQWRRWRETAGADGWPPEAYGEAVRQLKAETDTLNDALANASKVSVLNPYAGRPGALARAWDGLAPAVRRQIIVDTLDLQSQRLVVTPRPAGYRSNTKIDPTDKEWIAREWSRVRWEEVAADTAAAA